MILDESPKFGQNAERWWSCAVALYAVLAMGCSDDELSNRTLDCTIPGPAATPREALPPPVVAPCDQQGWCAEHPLPFRGDPGPIWHRQDQTIVTSSRGLVLRLRNENWEVLDPLPKPPGMAIDDQLQLNDIWVANDFIYIGGSAGNEGLLWAHDGLSWTLHQFDDFVPHHVWGTKEQEVMVVGWGARLWRDGEWLVTEPPRLIHQGLWGCEDTYVAAAIEGSFINEEAIIARYQDSWVKTADLPEVNVQFTSVSGTALDNVFASGTVNGLSQEVAWRFDGTKWTDMDYGGPGLHEIVAIGPGQAIATGADTGGGGGSVKRFDANGWTEIHNRSMVALGVATPEDILGVPGTGAGRMAQYDGSDWFEPFSLPVESPMNGDRFTGIWGDGGGALFLIALDGAIYERTGQNWVAMTTPDPDKRKLHALWGASATDVFVVGSLGLVWHWDGKSWSEMTLPSGEDTEEYTAVWGVDGSTVFAAHRFGGILRYDGKAWTRVYDASAGGKHIIWGASANDIWAIGEHGSIARYDGTNWDDSELLPGKDPAPAGIWGSAPDDVWVVGENRVWHWDGSSWGQEVLSTLRDGLAVWGTGAKDVYIVGKNGMAFHNDGSGWTDIHAEHPWQFTSLWGDGTTLRAVGEHATIMVR